MKKKYIALTAVAGICAAAFITTPSDYKTSLMGKLTPQHNITDLKDITKDIAKRMTTVTHDLGTHIAYKKSAPGLYLSGNLAEQNKDWESAYTFMKEAQDIYAKRSLAEEKDAIDGGHKIVLDRLFILSLLTGRIDEALALIPDLNSNAYEQNFGRVLQAVHDISLKNYDAAYKTLSDIDTRQFGGYIVPLLKSWTAISLNDHDLALKDLKSTGFYNSNSYNIHKALIYDFIGRTSDAQIFYKNVLTQNSNLQETLLATNFMTRQKEWRIASNVYAHLLNSEPHNSFIKERLDTITAQETPAPLIKTADDGLAYILSSMSQFLYDRQSYDSALIYAQISDHIAPNSDFNQLRIGNLLLSFQDNIHAAKAYQKINPESILYNTAQFKIARTLENDGNSTAALEHLNTLSKEDSMELEAFIRIGDLYQREEDFKKSLSSYNKALDLLETPAARKKYWSVIYARGIAHHELDNWPLAEKDLKEALKYNPSSASILNYLGYSWIDQGINTEDALNMIKQAVAIQPKNGYIIDSYGWAFYKMGDFGNAVFWLEKAVEHHPKDPILNDHLGDAYWQDGRKKEARFQWERAASFAEEDMDLKEAITKKLHHGIPTLTDSKADDTSDTKNSEI